MATPPVLRIRINGGAWQTGAVTAVGGDVVEFSLASTSGFGSKLWELYCYPPDYTLPAGWTVDAGNADVYYYSGDTPPSLTLPAEAVCWGKWLPRVTCDGDATLKDESTTFETLSANGLHDIAPLEGIQFGGSYKGWAKYLQLLLRNLENLLAGTGLGTAVPSEWVFTLSGVYDGATLTGYIDPPRRAMTNRTISKVEIYRRTAGTSGTTRVDVKKGGVSIFSGSGTQPQVTAAAGDLAYQVVTAFNVGAAAMVAGNRLEVTLEAVETYLAGPPEGPEGILVVVYFA